MGNTLFFVGIFFVSFVVGAAVKRLRKSKKQPEDAVGPVVDMIRQCIQSGNKAKLLAIVDRLTAEALTGVANRLDVDEVLVITAAMSSAKRKQS